MRRINPFQYGIIEKELLNEIAMKNYIQLIDEAEEFYEQQILSVVLDMKTSEKKADIVCLSGPSASGKTTTAFALKRAFQKHGRNAQVISLDDFYLAKDQAPLNKDGQPDFESIFSLDIECINKCIKELVEQGETTMPIFNFQRKCREEQGRKVWISGDDVVIIEGIHGLNPILTELAGEDTVTKIYASARSKFVDGDRVILTPKDIRLMRRMVRDVTERNTQPEDTMEMWNAVCEGEREFINPYRDLAKYKLDTTLDYEPNI